MICRPVDTSKSTDPVAYGFTAQEALGFGLFNNGGIGIRDAGNPACGGCHPVTNPVPTPPASLKFPAFSEAAFQESDNFVPVERSLVVDPGFPLVAPPESGVHERGFFNLGLRPANDDLGNGRLDPYGNPLSISRMFLLEQAGNTVVDPTGITNRCIGVLDPGGTPPFPGCPGLATGLVETTPPALPLDLSVERHLVDGTFKTPSIRNVGLTRPYFHYGGYSDLRGVVEVYARGGARHMQLTTPPTCFGAPGTPAHT